MPAPPLAAAGAAALHPSLCLHIPSKPKTLLQNHPLYPPASSHLSLQTKEKILCLEIMGIDSGKALSLNPSLLSTSLHSIHSLISFLLSKNIPHKDFPKLFSLCPNLLSSDPKSDLSPVFYFLTHDLHVPHHNLRRVINKCPKILTSSVPDQLKPALFYLQRLGFKNPAQLAYQDPVLLVSSVENTLIPKLRCLESFGFLREEAVGMVLRCPALFTFSVENNLKPKFEYFVGEMKGELGELREFPHYFGFSLEKRIKARYLEVVKSGVKVPLAVMLKTTDEEFRVLITS